jgi:predicted SnoaL-like aldol condensation-catalyzing enzyme
MTNTDIVLRFEDEFKNQANLNIVDELMSPDFVHHAPFPGFPEGPAGMKAIGEFVFGAISDIVVTIDLTAEEGDLVADRVTARGTRKDTSEPISWVENHIYKLADGRIVEWWPAGAPPLD